MSAYRTSKLYRVRNGKFLGLCEGIARWRDIPVVYIRLGFVLAAFITGFIPVLVAYIIISLIVDTEPSDSAGFETNNYADGDYNDMKEKMNRSANREKDWERRFNED